MKYFPMFLRMAGETVVIAGGGEQAAQKTRLMLKTEARILIMAPALNAELAALERAGRIAHVPAVADPAALAGARLLFCATGCAGADAALASLGRAAGAVVNVVDRPDLCDALTPAIVDRDPVVVAIGTEGAAPVLARRIKTDVERLLDPALGPLTALLGAMRGAVAHALPQEGRRGFWAWAFSGALERLWRAGGAAAVRAEVAATLAAGGPPAQPGAVSLVGAGPGCADLITLRGVRRLQEADVIFYDRLADPTVLELARRDAERVLVGKTPGVREWSQPRINRLMVAAARQGKRVVRLKCGDPGIFGRAAEEIAALSEAGFAVEIVPGVTAAAAAAADAGRPLTDRAGGRAVTFVSAHPAEDGAPVDWTALARAGTNLAIYMGVARAAEASAALIAAGLPADCRATVVERAGGAQSRVLSTSLARLPSVMAAHAVSNPAVILVDNTAAAGVLAAPESLLAQASAGTGRATA
jgi:uroporphyrin-III C-methyltransferase/precorrin-2 dehydrogenase/sirohydrochlorin ferrochelatase